MEKKVAFGAESLLPVASKFFCAKGTVQNIAECLKFTVVCAEIVRWASVYAFCMAYSNV